MVTLSVGEKINVRELGKGNKNMYENVNAISAGVDMDVGMKDTAPPQISIMIDEE